ncbi:hypothetical protein CVU83_02555 [Candidatus Falkowbacteria bacterium HGW-Falkowbacteria-2]|uniref:DUF5667 domain-containing protein n=1 Tax=Candidatus Falkowbacteria bacterium HGW-Falkowbacteria-2 TaxID=2013769 RepID=A0A2N2DZD7_9BACT|nr:MAG: hypothetical protein CVU83_02555 [Candidatus Falkowbacteria bacterium HGW-Falkowbacteria-2]
MKKIFALTLLLAMVFAAFIFLPVQAEENVTVTATTMTAVSATGTANQLERIPSPDQIKEFKVMKKEGNALWGIRLKNLKASSTSEMSQVKNDIRGELEKILAPQYINLYNQITKIGTSLWGIPKKASENKPVTPSRVVTADMIPCVTAAIIKKDDAVKKVIETSADNMVLAITARGECQIKAIATVENQAENLKACAKTFQETSKSVAGTARAAQQEAWKIYQTEMRACSVTSSNAQEAPLMIEDGGSVTLESVLN